MKKFLLAVCIAAVSAVGLNAQGIHLRAEVGGNFTNVDQKIKDKSIDPSSLTGFRAGVGVELGFMPFVYTATGLNYKMGGSERSFNNIEAFLKQSGEVETRNHSLSVPLNLGLRVPVVPGLFSVSVEGGVYVAYMLSAESSSVSNISKEVSGVWKEFKESSTTDLLKGDNLKRFEAGLGASVAAHYKSLYLRLGTTYGLTEMSKISEESVKNHEFYICLGLRF